MFADPRWQLVERILKTEPFQKSINLHRLLSYLAEHSIYGNHEALMERQIGTSVFGKPAGYSPAEDSVVRVHIRHLRLRLREYFAFEGKVETLIVNIPRGAYALEFHKTLPEAQAEFVQATGVPMPAEARARKGKTASWGRIGWLAFGVAFVAAAICAIGWYRSPKSVSQPKLGWPLNQVIQPGMRTTVVVSDSSLMLRLLGSKEITFEQYLDPGFRQKLVAQHSDEHISKLLNYISDSQLTSFADLAVAATLLKLAGNHADDMVLCSARDLEQRDLEHGNFVFIGSPISNPWVSLFEGKLNFEVTEDTIGGKMYFRNKFPLPGEKRTYQGLSQTGSDGDDYASIALLPSESGPGKVLIIQGLRQEGTEALGILLSDPNTRRALAQRLGVNRDSYRFPYFEALIRTKSVAGAPDSLSIVATRIIHP